MITAVVQVITYEGELQWVQQGGVHNEMENEKEWFWGKICLSSQN